MGHTRRRPITGTTPVGVGATYIIVEAAADDTNVQIVANGTVTFTVDSTLQNILYSTAAQAAINLSSPSDPDRYVDPTNAVWTEQLASAGVDANVTMVNEPIFALRINITAGVAGSVTYTVLQG
jgi:hypothetical protein